MGRFVLRGKAARRAVGVLALASLVLSCTDKGLGPVAQPAAAVAASPARTDPADSFNETLDLAGLQNRFEKVAQQIAPSVVAISATEADFNFEAALRPDDLNPDRLASMLAGSDRTVGTGFVIDSDGYILTNDHVVAHCEQLWITTDDRKVYPAMVIGSDPRSDLAVLKIPRRGLPAVTWADASGLRRGQWTIALGNPYGLAAEGEMCMSVGIISAMGRSLPKLSGKEDRLYSDLIQTTTQINPGNSGGPLFDIGGRVIGINSAVILPQKQTNGIGFAIPANARVMHIVSNLKAGAEVVYGYLGVKASTPTARDRRDARISEEIGAKVELVESESPASSAGLKRDDIVIQFNGETISDGEQFIRVVGGAPVDEAVAVTIARGEKRQDISIKLRRRELTSNVITKDRQRLRWRGMLLGPIPENWAFPNKKPSSSAGVMVINVNSDSPFAREGVAQGSVITAIAGKPIEGITGLQALINDLPTEACSLQLAARGDSAVVSIHE